MSDPVWSRIEPSISLGDVAPDLEVGIAARLADPLWLLARQWQLGELTGEDAASPVLASLTHVAFPIDRLDRGGGLAPLGAEPLEAQVERSPDPADAVLRERGLWMFQDLLEEEGLPPAAATFTDGDDVYDAITRGRLAERLGRPRSDALRRVASRYARWYGPRAGRTAGRAFVEERVESRFRVALRASEGDVVLSAPEHHGARVDWASFDVERIEPAAPPAVEPIRSELVPLALTVPGMPVVRFWELDDPLFDAGQVAVGPGDAARALLVEMHLAFASDWFLLPMPAQVGALVRVTELVVTDTFGERTRIPALDERRLGQGFGLWRVAGAGAAPPLDGLLLASTVADGMTGPPLEEVALVRDQEANVAWAVPRVVPDGVGQARPGNRAGTQFDARSAAPSAAPAEAALSYVPYRFPAEELVPLVLVEGQERKLVRATRIDGAERVSGHLIGEAFSLLDDELPSEGLILGRRYELVRSRSGALHLWITRTKVPGTDLVIASPGFDALVPSDREPGPTS